MFHTCENQGTLVHCIMYIYSKIMVLYRCYLGVLTYARIGQQVVVNNYTPTKPTSLLNEVQFEHAPIIAT